MDFTFTEEQQTIADLAEQIFSGSVDADRVAEVEATDERFDRKLWAELAASNLLGVAIPEAYGGLGFGIMEVALVLQQQGRRVAPVPLLPTLVQGGLPLAEFGSSDQHRRWLPGVVAGDTVLTGAYAEYGANVGMTSSVSARPHGDGWLLSGTKPAVPAMPVADAVVVPAETTDGLTVFVVPADAPGLSYETNETTNRELHASLRLVDVALDRDAVLGGVGDGAAIVTWVVDRILVAHSAIVLGCCEEALAMAAAYTSERHQFDRPLSTNQGVLLRAADCYIDIECLRVALWEAAWRLAEGRPAADQVRVAKWWAAEGGQRVVHHTQHLHGGMGADVDYPVHRYFLWVKQLETMLGGPTQQLSVLGRSLAHAARADAPA